MVVSLKTISVRYVKVPPKKAKVGRQRVLELQAGIHIGVDVGVLPTKGISLPFVSAGGTGLVLMGLAAGLIMSVGRSKWEQIGDIKDQNVNSKVQKEKWKGATRLGEALRRSPNAP